MIGVVIFVWAQQSGLVSGSPTTERSIAVSIADAPPLKNLPPQKALDTISPVSPYSVPVLDQRDVYSVSPAGHIVRRNILARTNVWVSAGATPFSDMIASEDRLYVIGQNSTVVARDEKSGALLWSRRVADAGNLQLSMIRGMLFVQGEDVTRLNPITGAILWHAQTGRVSKLVAPASVFASIAEGDPIQESIAVLNSASGKLLTSYNPGMPVGSAQILESQRNAVLVHASASATTIDEDGNALTRIVWLNSITGQIIKDWPYRPDAMSHGPDTGMANPIVDGKSMAFQVGDSIYRYDLETEPSSQHPLRIQGAGDLIAFRRGQLYTRSRDGLYVIEFEGDRAIRHHVLAYRYDPTLNQPALVQAEDTIAVSDGSVIQVLDLLTNKAQRYSASCGEILGVFRSRSLVAVQCENVKAAQAGAIYVVQLPGR